MDDGWISMREEDWDAMRQHADMLGRLLITGLECAQYVLNLTKANPVQIRFMAPQWTKSQGELEAYIKEVKAILGQEAK